MVKLLLSKAGQLPAGCLWEWLLAQTELQPAFGSLLTGTSQKTDSNLTMDDCGMRLLFVSINVASWPARSSLSSPSRSLAFPSQHFTSYQLIHAGVWVRIPGIPAPLSWLLLRWKKKIYLCRQQALCRLSSGVLSPKFQVPVGICWLQEVFLSVC